MLNGETIRKICLAYHRDKKPIRQIARELRLSKNTVNKVIRSGDTEFSYERSFQPRPKLGQVEERLMQLLSEDRDRPPRERRSAQVLFEELQREGFPGGYDSVRRYIRLRQLHPLAGPLARSTASATPIRWPQPGQSVLPNR